MAGLTGSVAASMPTSETIGTSVADPKLGSEWTDADGKKYVVVDCQNAFVAGEPALINSAHQASRMISDAVSARVGVMVAAVGGSDTKAYAQIYGLYEGAAGTSNVASSRNLGMPTGTSDLGWFQGYASSDEDSILIRNAYVVTAADSATTSPPSSFVSAAGTSTVAIGFSVWLNYPFIVGTGQATGVTHDT